MTLAVVEKFEQMILEVETATSGTYAKLCGILDVTISRTANIDSSEIPDCADESKPLVIEKQVRSLDVKVSGSGSWATTSNATLNAWWYSGLPKNIRLTHAAAVTGDPSIETGPAILSKLENSRTKGKKVTASIELEFSLLPTVTNAS